MDGMENGDGVNDLPSQIEASTVDKLACKSNDSETNDNSFFDASELYRIAVSFYKEKDGSKALPMSYNEKVNCVALMRQGAYGPHVAGTSSEVGLLDVVGKDRQIAWQALGDMSKEEAQKKFVNHIELLCPLFKPYLEALTTERLEKIRLAKEAENNKKKEEEELIEQKKIEAELMSQQFAHQEKQRQQEMAVRMALNQQTTAQFQQYVEQQSPGNKEQQMLLLQQLQEQHYQQYMQQVYQQQLMQQPAVQNVEEKAESANETEELPSNSTPSAPKTSVTTTLLTKSAAQMNAALHPQAKRNDDESEFPSIAAASMWTRQDSKEFKYSVRSDPESIIKVGSGETVTIRVPTHDDGTCLFWEFASDHHDLGFGVYFEWTIAENTNVSVHVSESSDEDIEDEDSAKPNDVELGTDVVQGKDSSKPPTDEIVPIYRRDCHLEVYCGSHMYPGKGVYLLKFDNSYSLWRSKTLYYRVYYTR